MRIDKHMVHSIAWVDLAASDLEASLKFYTDYMGWTASQVPGTDYHLFMNGDAPVAGAMAISAEMKGMPQTWMVYVAVSDARDTCDRVTDHGGIVFRPPFQIPDGGTIAVIGDPAGSAICVYEGVEDAGFRQFDEPSAPCWFDCFSRDAAASNEFYASVFGWTVETMEGGPNYFVYSNHDWAVGGCFAMDENFPADIPSHWRPTFSTSGRADEWAAGAQNRGARLSQDPMDTPFGRSFAILDPWGAPVGFIDRSTATR